jgi:hypothetical protein
VITCGPGEWFAPGWNVCNAGWPPPGNRPTSLPLCGWPHSSAPNGKTNSTRLLVVDAVLGVSRFAWLRRGATSAAAEVVKAELDKLAYLRSLDADTLDLSVLPPGRRRFLAQVGRRSTARALARSDPVRRHPVLLATLAEAAVEVLDELVLHFDQALSGSDSQARHELDERLVAGRSSA